MAELAPEKQELYYPEMADIFKTTLNECKRVYWHDIKDLRKKLNPNPEEK